MTSPRVTTKRNSSTPTLPKKIKSYSTTDIKNGLLALINGKSKRSASELCGGVPPTSLVRHYQKLTSKRPNAKQPLTKAERVKYIEKLLTWEPALMGQAKRIFLPHEELLIVQMLEVAAECAFPYNKDALEATALNLGKAAYGAKFTLGACGKWRRGFERRWKHRIDKVKSSSISQVRASSAKTKVRDLVFQHFIQFLDNLVKDDKLTAEQRDNLQDHIINADEVGGDEKGKRKKVYQGLNAAWRATTRDGDHNPFHVTVMLVSFANGLLSKAVSLIHSAPGSKKPCMRENLHDHIPMHWHVRRTTTGSMTRELFQDWAVSASLVACLCRLPVFLDVVTSFLLHFFS